MDQFEQWLLGYGVNTMIAGFVLWVIFVEIPYCFVLHSRTKQVRAAVLSHLNACLPSVWNHNPSQEIVNIPRQEWMDLAQLNERDTLEYRSGLDKAKLVVVLLIACAAAASLYWLLVLLPVAFTSFFQGKFEASKRIAKQVYDLKEQPWITRNRLLNEAKMSMNFDNLPLDYPGNPLHNRDAVGLDTSFHHLIQK